jgi:hypothetical protein
VLSTGSNNTAFGSFAGDAITTSGNNTCIGHHSGSAISTGTNNTCLGNYAGDAITTGDYNVCLGNAEGSTRTTGDYNISVGNNNDHSATGCTHEIIIGANNATGKGDSTAFIAPGSGAVYAGNNSANFSTTSDRRIKKNIADNNTGLDAINQVRVRNFEYRTPDEIDELPKEAAIGKEGIQLGVIAQEIQTVLPDVVRQETTGCLTVDPDNMTWYLVNAVKQLSAKVEELEKWKEEHTCCG